MSDDDFMCAGFPERDGSSDDDFVMGMPAPRRRVAGAPALVESGEGGEGSVESSEDFVVAGGGGIDHGVRPRKGRRPRAQGRIEGSFWALAASGDEGSAGFGRQYVFALIRMTWKLIHPPYNVGNRNDAGTLECTADRCLSLQRSVALPENIHVPCGAAAALQVSTICDQSSLDLGNGMSLTLGDFLSTEGVVCQCVVKCSDAEVAKVSGVATDGVPRVFRSAPVHSRGPFPRIISGGQPNKKDLKLWRKTASANYTTAGSASAPGPSNPPPTAADPLLHLPEGPTFERWSSAEYSRKNIRGRVEIDPVRKIRAINVAQHLRQPALFQQVLEGCIDYLGMEEGNMAIVHDYALDPSRATMDRALARADVVAMNLQRRQFQKWRQEDAVRTINVYSDASPVVGAELQGMILDVNLKDGSMVRITLPGSTLAYGFCGTLSKSVALLHALWLVGGPRADDIRWLCSKIRSLTTDFGVEMHLLEAPDVIDAFIHFMGGAPLEKVASLVKNGLRMWPRALRIAGWSHSIGGIMKTAAEAFTHWPSHLADERSLCKFYKNVTYRRHIVRVLAGRHPEADLPKILKSFTAGFAKWRYETECEVLRQLLPLRDLCESKMDPALFPKVQDQEELDRVFKACRRKEFWRWAQVVFPEVFQRLEHLRKWGMVCDHAHCEELRKASNYRKHIPCPRTAKT